MARARRKTSSRKRKSGGKFIQSAIKRPGQLHRDLGVPQGKKIPEGKLRAAAKRKDKVGQRARFALHVLKPAAAKRRKRSTARKRR